MIFLPALLFDAAWNLKLDHGGFGILLAQKLVDELIFSEKGNDVVLIKYLE